MTTQTHPVEQVSERAREAADKFYAGGIISRDRLREHIGAFERDILAGQSVGDESGITDETIDEAIRHGFGERFGTPASDSPAIPEGSEQGLLRNPLPHEEIAISAHEAVRGGDARLGYFRMCQAYGELNASKPALASTTPDPDSRVEKLEAAAFNRGVLIAVSTLINCWGHSTETRHLLDMINADAAMVEGMGFDDYDRLPLLKALNGGSDEGE